jgi:hypothetical protein
MKLNSTINLARKYMVVISGETISASGKRLTSSGVGFGSNRESALAEAKQNLAQRLPQWSEYLNSYSIIEEKELFG